MAQKYRFIEQENGKKAHKHELLINGQWQEVRGASTIVKVLGKEGLTYWAAGLAVKELSGIEDCKVLTKIKNGKAKPEEIAEVENSVVSWLNEHAGMGVEDYIKLCQKAYSAHATNLKDTAEAGTDLHELLEDYVKDCTVSNDSKPKLLKGDTWDERVVDFSKWCVDNVKRFLWSEAHCYNEELLVGGITDCGAEFKDGTFGIIDFKSAKETYFNHFVQCAVYDLLIKKNSICDKDGVIAPGLERLNFTKYVIVPFGAKEFMAVENTGVEGFKRSALACMALDKEIFVFNKE